MVTMNVLLIEPELRTDSSALLTPVRVQIIGNVRNKVYILIMIPIVYNAKNNRGWLNQFNRS